MNHKTKTSCDITVPTSLFTCPIEIKINKQMELNQTYKLLYIKGNPEQIKKWDKIFAINVTNKDLITKINKQLIQLKPTTKPTA